MARTGFDRRTGRMISGWPHVRQSIEVIVTTEIESRVQRRQFGSVVPGLIDRPQNIDTIMDLMVGVADALEFRRVDGAYFGDPSFRLSNVSIVPSVDGHVSAVLDGQYFPFGHIGDYSVIEDVSGVLINV